MGDVYIRASSAYLPNEPVSNAQIEDMLGQIGPNPARERSLVLGKNGIKQRYFAVDPQTRIPTHSNAQLTALAVAGLSGPDFHLGDLEVLACGTSSPDLLAPGHGVMVHGEIDGAPSCEVVSLAGICCAGVAALRYAAMAVGSGQARHAVASGSEIASSFMRAEHFTPEYDKRAETMAKAPELAFDGVFLRWMLSDGAGALLLGDQPATSGLSLKLDWIDMRSYANEQDTCMYAGGRKTAEGQIQGWREYATPHAALQDGAMGFQQDVKQLNEHIVTLTVEKALPQVLARHPMQAEDIDWFLPHYSSDFFRNRVSRALEKIGFDIPQSRWFTNLSEVGNVGSASIYLMIDALMRSGDLKMDQKVLCFVPESGRFSAAYMLFTVCGAAAA